MTALPVRQVVWKGGTCVLLGRVEGIDAAPVTQASVSSITGTSRDLSDDSDTALTVNASDAIFDTLQTDGTWTVDDQGYNFRYVINQATLVSVTKYRISITIVPADSSGNLVVVFQLNALDPLAGDTTACDC